MANGLANRSVIVTGAAHGIGLAIARRFVRAGASVMMADIDEARLDTEIAALSGAGYDGKAQGFTADLREKLSMTNLMAATLDAFDTVHVLVNAMRLLTTTDPLKPEADAFEAMLTQNVTAPLLLSQIVARRMIEIAATETPTPIDRAILNISSIQTSRARPELLGYSVSCAALDQLTRGLAVAMAPHRIRVNAIAIGGVMSSALTRAYGDSDDLRDALEEVIPLGRLGDPAEVAEAALYLASPGASFITGQILAVDGGRMLLDPLDTREV